MAIGAVRASLTRSTPRREQAHSRDHPPARPPLASPTKFALVATPARAHCDHSKCRALVAHLSRPPVQVTCHASFPSPADLCAVTHTCPGRPARAESARAVPRSCVVHTCTPTTHTPPQLARAHAWPRAPPEHHPRRPQPSHRLPWTRRTVVQQAIHCTSTTERTSRRRSHGEHVDLPPSHPV